MNPIRLSLLALSVTTFSTISMADPQARIIGGTTSDQSDWHI